MNLLLMRHGEAEVHAGRDFDRQLTDHGRQEVIETAGKFLSMELQVESIQTSPYTRARQTAELMAIKTGVEEIYICNAITPNSDPLVAISELSELLAESGTALAVMHQPIISRLIALLCEVDQPMQTASLAVIELEQFHRGCGELKCVL